jgi:ferric-dicitrate binding protein FerR (iron transport regulator)
MSLATDPYFLGWKLLGDPAAETFWEIFVEQCPAMKNVVEEAGQLLKKVRFNASTLTEEEKQTEVMRLVAAVKRRRRRLWTTRAGATLAGAAAVVALIVAVGGQAGEKKGERSATGGVE